jgi:hypothetical protein
MFEDWIDDEKYAMRLEVLDEFDDRVDVDVAKESWWMQEELQLARGTGLFVAGRACQEWLC